MEFFLNSVLFKFGLYLILAYLSLKLIFEVYTIFSLKPSYPVKKTLKSIKKTAPTQGLVSKKVLTKDEITMFEALKKAYPNEIILVQVSMNAFMTTQDISVRNKFSRLYVDFLIVDSDYHPVVSIELDSHYHTYIKDKDKRRDELINSVGIPVVRFKHIPDVKSIRKVLSKHL
ncbi:DUF2726 domain-containing protein [Acinetobacter gandensis]|uniref:DUF2726 domain-containing protein n=1 Tax=Acinetobacter gandensis TaxID=1443941 RepID=UPI003989D0CB